LHYTKTKMSMVRQVGCNAILKYREERNLAVAMALHSRLGQDSPLALVNEDLFKHFTTRDDTIHCTVLVNGERVEDFDFHRISKLALGQGIMRTPYTMLQVGLYDTITLVLRGAVEGLECMHQPLGYGTTYPSLQTTNPGQDGEGVLHVITYQVWVGERYPATDVCLIHTQRRTNLPPVHKIVLAVDVPDVLP